MIRKFVTATLLVALAGLFYYTDRLEQKSRWVASETSEVSLRADHLNDQPDIRNRDRRK